MSEVVEVEVAAGVATLTMNRPKALNALDHALRDALVETLQRVEHDPAVRVVVLAGAGAGFMAGGDVKWFHGLLDKAPEERRALFGEFIHHAHPMIVAMRRIPKPIIASVRGPVAGIGMSLMMACDLAIASAEAFFTLAYIHLGTSPDGGSTWFLPRLVGMKRAMQIALLGDRFGPDEALRLGLVNEVVPSDQLAARTAELAGRLAAAAPQALASTKRLLQQSSGVSLETQLQAELDSFAACAATADFAEGVRAFVEKRPPRFGAS